MVCMNRGAMKRGTVSGGPPHRAPPSVSSLSPQIRSDNDRKALARELSSNQGSVVNTIYPAQVMVMYCDEPQEAMVSMVDDANQFFAWALGTTRPERPARDQEKLDDLIKKGSIITTKNRDGKDFFCVADGVSCRGIQCPFHPSHNHDIMHCLVGYLGNGLPAELKLAISDESKKVRSQRGSVAANSFRSEAIKEFLLGRLHVDLKQYPALKPWKERTEAQNIREVQELINRSVKLMRDPDVPGFRTNADVNSRVCQLLANTAAELLSGGSLLNIEVSPVSGKLCGRGDMQSADYGNMEVNENEFCSVFMQGIREGLSYPMGMPSFPTLLGETTLAKLD